MIKDSLFKKLSTIEMPEISYFIYSRIGDNFYCVYGYDENDKVFIQGEVCRGVLMILKLYAQFCKVKVKRVRKPFLSVDNI